MNHKIGNNDSDQYLVEKVISGDTYAFGIIIRNTEGLVAQIVFKMINNAEDRKDIAQDIYLKAYHNLYRFKFQSKLSTWIGKIAYNTCLNYLEKKKPELFQNLYERTETDEVLMDRKLNNAIPGTENQTEKTLFRKELSRILNAEIEQLPPAFKTLITLYHNEELSYEEITQITSLPEGTVKNYLYRARKVLKKSLLLKYKKEEL